MADRLQMLRAEMEDARRATAGGDGRPRRLGDDPPWNFEDRVRVLASRARRTLIWGRLDSGTIGRVVERVRQAALPGEAPTPELRFVVHAAPWARARPDHLGDRVVVVGTPARLPFPDRTFDLILCWNGGLEAEELVRLTSPGGALLVDRGHPDSASELRSFFPRMRAVEDHFDRCKFVLRQARFEFIDVRAHDRPIAFRALGEIAHAIESAPGLIPGFDPEADLAALLRLEEARREERGILLTESRYIVEARRPDLGD